MLTLARRTRDARQRDVVTPNLLHCCGHIAVSNVANDPRVRSLRPGTVFGLFMACPAFQGFGFGVQGVGFKGLGLELRV